VAAHTRPHQRLQSIQFALIIGRNFGLSRSFVGDDQTIQQTDHLAWNLHPALFDLGLFLVIFYGISNLIG
jgi:hypothetical protein